MRILAFACAFAPGIGSESGSGWVWARLLASLGETWIITSANPPRAETIEAKLRDLVEGQRIHVVYADIPLWAQRIVGKTEFMERMSYFLWQIAALRAARRLQKQRPFDLVWHLTWANVWIGSLACFVGPRLVFGDRARDWPRPGSASQCSRPRHLESGTSHPCPESRDPRLAPEQAPLEDSRLPQRSA